MKVPSHCWPPAIWRQPAGSEPRPERGYSGQQGSNAADRIYSAGLGERRSRMTPAPSLGTVLGRIAETQAPLPAPIAVLIGLAAVAAVSLQEIWLLAQHVNTIAHEGAHAIIGSAVGRPIKRVTLLLNGNGRTEVGPGQMPGDLTIGVVGYLGPSAFGLAAAKLIQLRHSAAVLWLALILLAVLLVALRNVVGLLSLLLT